MCIFRFKQNLYIASQTVFWCEGCRPLQNESYFYIHAQFHVRLYPFWRQMWRRCWILQENQYICSSMRLDTSRKWWEYLAFDDNLCRNLSVRFTLREKQLGHPTVCAHVGSLFEWEICPILDSKILPRIQINNKNLCRFYVCQCACGQGGFLTRSCMPLASKGTR